MRIAGRRTCRAPWRGGKLDGCSVEEKAVAGGFPSSDMIVDCLPDVAPDDRLESNERGSSLGRMKEGLGYRVDPTRPLSTMILFSVDLPLASSPLYLSSGTSLKQGSFTSYLSDPGSFEFVGILIGLTGRSGGISIWLSDQVEGRGGL